MKGKLQIMTSTDRKKAARAERMKQEQEFIQEKRKLWLASQRDMTKIVKVLFPSRKKSVKD